MYATTLYYKICLVYLTCNLEAHISVHLTFSHLVSKLFAWNNACFISCVIWPLFYHICKINKTNRPAGSFKRLWIFKRPFWACSHYITPCTQLSFNIRTSLKLDNASWVMDNFFSIFCCYRII